MRSVIVIGDALLDVDVQTTAGRLVPDSAAPVLDEQHRTHRPGGAALAARLAATDPEVAVTLITAIPDDAAGGTLRALLGRDLTLLALPCHGRTGVKTRLRHAGQTVARLDQGGAGVTVRAVPDEVRDALAAADAVLVSDYGRGVTTTAEVEAVLDAEARRRPLVWDPHPRGAAPVPGTRVATPNAGEAARVCGERDAGTVADACRQARALVAAWSLGGVALTLGARGAVLASGPHSAAVYPARHVPVADSCGAGDRFAARVATALAAGALTSEAVAAGVAAATGFLAAGGVAQLGASDNSSGSSGSDAVSAAAQPSGGLLCERLAAVRASGGTVVATGGCFDLLHAGHLATLTAARALGDFLVVCVNSDASVRRRKGAGRPVQQLADRVRLLEGLQAVDAVVVFDEDTPKQVLPAIRPDIWVKGGDYADSELPETALVRSWRGEVVTVPYLPGHSTSELLTRARA